MALPHLLGNFSEIRDVQVTQILSSDNYEEQLISWASILVSSSHFRISALESQSRVRPEAYSCVNETEKEDEK